MDDLLSILRPIFGAPDETYGAERYDKTAIWYVEIGADSPDDLRAMLRAQLRDVLEENGWTWKRGNVLEHGGLSACVSTIVGESKGIRLVSLYLDVLPTYVPGKTDIPF